LAIEAEMEFDMSVTWDAPTRKRFKEYLQLLLGLILGAIVLLPALVGLTKPPWVMAWAVPITLSLAFLSVACLGVAMLSVVLDAKMPPFRLIGAGSWLGLLTLFLMLVYVTSNVIADLGSTPVIVAVKVSPVGVSPGKYVDLDVDATDKSGDRLVYRWMFQGRVISELRNGYLKAPKVAGLYPVTVVVGNERAVTKRTVQIEVVADPPAPAPSR
jgi:hypothetical protein